MRIYEAIWLRHASLGGYRLLRQLRKQMSIRSVQAYSIASYDAAMILAATLPFHLPTYAFREIIYRY